MDSLDTLYLCTLDRERREIGRLNQVVELPGHDGCPVSRLGAHFGEPLAVPCGHCSWCRNGHQPMPLLPRPAAAIDPAVWQQELALRRTQPTRWLRRGRWHGCCAA